MSLDALRAALDTLDEPAVCGGGFPVDERLAITLPDGDACVRRRTELDLTLVCELEFAEDGFVGNAAYDAYLYRLATLEVTR